jgi:hypothetical protein
MGLGWVRQVDTVWGVGVAPGSLRWEPSSALVVLAISVAGSRQLKYDVGSDLEE